MENQSFDPNSLREIVKNLDDYIWNITSNAVCTICHEIFTDPVTTSCSHTFCSNCLKILLSKVNNVQNSCPLCRNSIKRREANSNHVLKNISKICFDLPAAFREDVMSLSPTLKDLSKDLVDSSRIAGLCLDKDRGRCDVKKQRKSNKKVNDSLLSLSVVGPSGGEINHKNEECLDLKSISQIELKSELYVPDSLEIEKKLRSVKRVPSKQKVNDWLEEVNKRTDSSSLSLKYNWESHDDSIIPGTENKNCGLSMIRIDYDKSKKPNGIVDSNVKGMEIDPYEFIASQRTYGMKTKRKSTRGRKKKLPEFQTIQNFTKESVKRNYMNKTTDLFDDICDDNLQKTRKTYSRKSDKTITVGENTQEILKDNRKITSDSEDSSTSRSNIVPRARRRITPLCPDIDSDNSFDTDVKRAKLDSNIVIFDCDTNSKSDDERSGKTKTMETAKVPNTCSVSPGWTRVSNSKMDFEIAGKCRRPCRKSLNISGGEPSSNSSKKSFVELSPEDENLLNNDVYIEDLSQNSERLVGFESPSSEDKKKDFKLMVEKMERDLELEMNGNTQDNKNDKFTEENATVTFPKEIIHTTPKNKIIPFALLGKIKKKKKSSILFVKLGRLSPNYKRSRSTVVKLIFPKTASKNGRKVRCLAVGTQTDLPSPFKLNKSSETITCEQLDREEQKKMNAEIQTTESFLRLSTKEVQTSQMIQQRNVTVQTVKDDINSRVLEEQCTPLLKVQENNSEEVYLDAELESQLNKTWNTQDKRSLQNMKSVFPDEKESDSPLINLDSSDTEVLMQRVIDNINLDLVRAKAVSHSPVKRPQQCEESDSDIFIEQTPPRNNSKNSSTMLKTNEEECRVNLGPDRRPEDSFLILSECQSNIPDYSKRSNIERNELPQEKENLLPNLFTDGNNENDKNELNIKSGCHTTRDESLSKRLRIVSSGVVNRKNIDKFVNKFKVEHLSQPRKDMTHLIVGLHENEDEGLVPYCTLKLLYAIANKKWIVTEAWVEKCLSSNAVVAEEPFESVDPAGGNGCSLARLSSDYLLKNCEIYLSGEYESITQEEFSSLISDCGGRIVRQLNEFSFSPGIIRMILVDDSDVEDDSKILDLMRKYNTLVMSRDVIILSIQSYKIVNLTPFLIHSVPYEEMLKWGYPPDLVKMDCENEKDEGCSE